MSSAGGSASASGGGVLERMVEEATGGGVGGMEVEESDGGVRLQDDGDVEMVSQYEGKGKGKVAALPAEEGEEMQEVDERPFRLFDLPTEIRLEIYRACLTRPYKILLSKRVEKPAPKVEEKLEDEDGSLQDLDQEEYQALRAAGMHVQDTWSQQTRPARATLAGQVFRRGDPRGPARPTLRASSSSSSSRPSTTNASSNTQSPPTLAATSSSTSSINNNIRRAAAQTMKKLVRQPSSSRSRATSSNPLIVPLLGASKTVYKEARDVLYSENIFTLDIFTAVSSLAALHQRSRRRIRHVELEIPTYTEILESFSETVRLGLRYCFGLRRLVVHTPFTLPGGEAAAAAANAAANHGAGGGAAGGVMNGAVIGAAAGGNTTVYANGFDILRWLPQTCEVVLEGTRNREIDAVVGRHLHLAGVQDPVSTIPAQVYLSRCRAEERLIEWLRKGEGEV